MLIDDFGFNDLQDLVRIDVSATGTLVFTGIGMVALGFEIDYCLGGISRIDLVSPPVHKNDTVEHLIEVGGGLMNVYKHQFSLEYLLPKQVHRHF